MKILNVREKDNKLFLNETSFVIQASNNDVAFQRIEPVTEESQQNTGYKNVKDVMIKNKT